MEVVTSGPVKRPKAQKQPKKPSVVWRVLKAIVIALVLGVATFAAVVAIGTFGLGVVFTNTMLLAVGGVIGVIALIGIVVGSLPPTTSKPAKLHKEKIFINEVLGEVPEEQKLAHAHKKPKSGAASKNESKKKKRRVVASPLPGQAQQKGKTPESQADESGGEPSPFAAGYKNQEAASSAESLSIRQNEQGIMAKLESINRKAMPVVLAETYIPQTFSKDELETLVFTPTLVRELEQRVQRDEEADAFGSEELLLPELMMEVLKTQAQVNSALFYQNLSTLYNAFDTKDLSALAIVMTTKLCGNLREVLVNPNNTLLNAWDSIQKIIAIQGAVHTKHSRAALSGLLCSPAESVYYFTCYALWAQNYELIRQLVNTYPDVQIDYDMFKSLNGASNMLDPDSVAVHYAQTECLLALRNAQQEPLVQADTIAHLFTELLTDTPGPQDVGYSEQRYNNGMQRARLLYSHLAGQAHDTQLRTQYTHKMQQFDTWCDQHPAASIERATR